MKFSKQVPTKKGYYWAVFKKPIYNVGGWKPRFVHYDGTDDYPVTLFGSDEIFEVEELYWGDRVIINEPTSFEIESE